eukprot:SAG31_NODE_35400_length_323_cov_1.138393_1_plen_41_part_10
MDPGELQLLGAMTASYIECGMTTKIRRTIFRSFLAYTIYDG